MFTEEFGKNNDRIIVMLHGAFDVHTFARQYELADRYHLIVPHIMGYGKHTDRDFVMPDAVNELEDFIRGLGRKVTLVGMSLGAQLAYQLVCQAQELFERAVIVSPWLLKTPEVTEEKVRSNAKELEALQRGEAGGMGSFLQAMTEDQKRDFWSQIDGVTMTTVENCLRNGIVISDAFRKVKIPVTAMAGDREIPTLIKSVEMMDEMNPLCSGEIWMGAGHNIPMKFWELFNKRLRGLMEAED